MLRTLLALVLATMFGGAGRCLVAQDTSDVNTAARHAFYATIVRAHLITLAVAESAYFVAHGRFAIDLTSLTWLDGTPLPNMDDVEITMELKDSTWHATGRAPADSIIVCWISASGSGRSAKRTLTRCAPH